MSDVLNKESQQLLERLVRKGGEQTHEIAVVTSPGARITAWAVKVKSLSSYNMYNVQPVEIADAGVLPIEVGGQMQAFNLAESFIQTGQLAVGTYVLMCRVGDKNVFYAPA